MARTNKLRILLINTYPKDKPYSKYEKRLYPGHQLFGALELKRNDDVEILMLEQEKYPFINRIGNWFDITLLDQQIRALFLLRKCDVIYAPYAATNTKLIILLKLFGIVRKPVVILVHHYLFGEPSQNKLKRLLVKKLIGCYDTIVFLSNTMKTNLENAYQFSKAHVSRHFHVFQWGVDAAFFEQYLDVGEPMEKSFIFSSGNNGRDFDILLESAKQIKFPFKIYCKPTSFPKAAVIPPNVEILSGDFPFAQICRDYAAARISLVPLAPNPEGITGITSLFESMALGKPIIMTKNENIDIDCEYENIGLTVNENDVDGWVEAISSLLNDHERLKEMGENSLRLAKEKFNINLFAKNLAKAMEDTYQRHADRKSHQ